MTSADLVVYFLCEACGVLSASEWSCPDCGTEPLCENCALFLDLHDCESLPEVD